MPKPIRSLRRIKVDAVTAGMNHMLALAADDSVYGWGSVGATNSGALGLGQSASDAAENVQTPRRIPTLRVAGGL
jgi:alpha-tubulin suppressor-like RCC1 family protein